jgi:hypothetical protein
MLPVPFARRDWLTSAVGPDSSGSKPGIEWVQTPDKSGIDELPCVPPWGPGRGRHRLRGGGRHSRYRQSHHQKEITPLQLHVLLLFIRPADASCLHPLRVVWKGPDGLRCVVGLDDMPSSDASGDWMRRMGANESGNV